MVAGSSDSLDTADFSYDLPPELIAQQPANRRDGSRLLVIDRGTAEIAHYHFSDLPGLLKSGDLLIVNDSKVLPARLRGVRLSSGGSVELLLLQELTPDQWLTLARPAKRVRVGDVLQFGEGRLTAVVQEIREDGQRVVQLIGRDGTVHQLLDQIGELPLPPYIHQQAADRSRYQTVYAREPGSAAAPTAGLHFTEELLNHLRERGVAVRPVTLHVGLGTFRPVQVDRIEDHHMHAELGMLPPDTAAAIQATHAAGGRVIAVGTTVVRVLESAALAGATDGWSGWTSIFIYPGFTFQCCDGLITNFHLPRSTLLMLVSAFAGKQLIENAYQLAIAERYRFFSFGDAMFIR